MTIAEAIRLGSTRLAAAGIDAPRLESRLLLAHALGRTTESVIRDLTAETGPSCFDILLARRAAHEPMAHILGSREFWSLRFQVSPATLIPRADSETVVEAALAACPAPDRVLDLGCGTACLLLAVLHERPGAFGIGIDLSPEATALAQSNARSLGLDRRSAFVCGDWDTALAGGFDLVISNPPYIPTPDLAGLMPDVVRYEPARALDGGQDGLAAYRAIITALPGRLAQYGVAVLELGIGQDEAVSRLAEAAGFHVSRRVDLSGIVRAVILRPG